MGFHKEIRHSYLGGFSILLVEAFFWILAGIVNDFISIKIAILIIIISGTFFYPLGLLMQTILKRPKVKKENPSSISDAGIYKIVSPVSYFLLISPHLGY